MTRLAIAAALLLASAAAQAQAWGVATVASYHLKRNGYCEFNPGVGVELGANLRFIAGEYRNSFCDTTVYAGGSYTRALFGPVRAGVTMVVATGYPNGTMVTPPVPTLMLEGERYGANVIIAPPIGKYSGVVGLQLKYRFR